MPDLKSKSKLKMLERFGIQRDKVGMETPTIVTDAFGRENNKPNRPGKNIIALTFQDAAAIASQAGKSVEYETGVKKYILELDLAPGIHMWRENDTSWTGETQRGANIEYNRSSFADLAGLLKDATGKTVTQAASDYLTQNPVALKLSETQASLFLTEHRPNSLAAQAEASYEITHEDKPLSLLGDSASLKYSSIEDTYYASVLPDAKDRFAHKLTELEQQAILQGRTATEYRTAIASIVGVPESRAFEYKESTGNIHRFEAPDGRRINIDSKGQFYDGELRPIDHEAGSSYQRMTAEEWKSHGYDNTRQLMRHLREFTQPSIDRFVQEEKLGGLEHASDTQQDRLRDTLKQHLGLGTEIASLAVVQQILDRKYAVGMEPTQRENMEQEYLHDTLVGKEGPSYENAVREAKYASKMAAPVLADFSRENNVPIAQLTAEQIEQVSRAVSRQHGISLALARQQTDYLLIKEQENDLHRNVILERGVGPENTTHYTWKQNSGDIESYQHNTTGRYVHLDSNSYFYDTNRTPIDASAALSHAEQKQMIAPYNEYAVDSPNPARDRQTMNLQSLREGRTDHSLPTEQHSQVKEFSHEESLGL